MRDGGAAVELGGQEDRQDAAYEKRSVQLNSPVGNKGC